MLNVLVSLYSTETSFSIEQYLRETGTFALAAALTKTAKIEQTPYLEERISEDIAVMYHQAENCSNRIRCSFFCLGGFI